MLHLSDQLCPAGLTGSKGIGMPAFIPKFIPRVLRRFLSLQKKYLRLPRGVRVPPTDVQAGDALSALGRVIGAGRHRRG